MATPTATITGIVTIGSIHVPLNGAMPTAKGSSFLMTYKHGGGSPPCRGTAAEVLAWVKATLAIDLSTSVPPTLQALSVQIESLTVDTSGAIELKLEFGSVDDKKQWASQWQPVETLKGVLTMSGLKVDVKRPADSATAGTW